MQVRLGCTTRIEVNSRLRGDEEMRDFGRHYYLDDALLVDFDIANFRIDVLSPVDLAVSKIARLADNDKEDIYALVKLGLTTAAKIKERAKQALIGYVGGQEMLLHKLNDAISIANSAQSADDAGK